MEGNGHNRILQIDEEFKKNPPKVVTPEVKWCRVYLPNQSDSPTHVVAKASDINTFAHGVPLNSGQGIVPMFVSIIKNAHEENGTPIEGQLEVMNGCVIVQPMNKPDWSE